VNHLFAKWRNLFFFNWLGLIYVAISPSSMITAIG